MTNLQTPPVVVGYDGSPSSRSALMLAAGEAVRRGRHLLVVHALETTWDQDREGTSRDPLAQALHLVRPLISGDGVAVRDGLGAAADVLLTQAENADLLVVGRGEPGLLGWFAGSVAVDVICRAHCPVIVVTDPGPHVAHDGPVVAGIDRISADVVLEAAFLEADLRDSDLIVVHSWSPLHWLGPDGIETIHLDDELTQDQQERWLREVIAPFQAKYPGVPVTEAPREGKAATLLAQSSGSASLLVVGTRGRGPVSGLLLGSVGQKLLRHALCPVMVVR